MINSRTQICGAALSEFWSKFTCRNANNTNSKYISVIKFKTKRIYEVKYQNQKLFKCIWFTVLLQDNLRVLKKPKRIKSFTNQLLIAFNFIKFNYLLKIDKYLPLGKNNFEFLSKLITCWNSNKNFWIKGTIRTCE